MKPIPPTTSSRFTDRKTSRTNLTRLKPSEVFHFLLSLSSVFLPSPKIPSSLLSFFLFLFLLPSILYHFYSFFLPRFIYFFVLIFVKSPSYLDSDLYSFFLPPFPFLFPFSLLPFSFYTPIHSPFPTGETIKPGALKRPELDPVTAINVSLTSVSTGK